MAKKQKLKLTWIGKDDEVRLEPRILIEDPELSYGDTDTENMIIHGDNLLALKALEQDYTGQVKCIYTDEVQEKKLAAIQYCKYATEYTTSNGGKGWEYMIIPHTEVKLNHDLSYFVSRYMEK